jgi:hypothetical protein
MSLCFNANNTNSALLLRLNVSMMFVEFHCLFT